MRALVLLSGGVDSATCLAMAAERFGAGSVGALSVFYGQKHEREIEAAQNIAVYYGVEHFKIDLNRVFQYSDSSLLSHSQSEVPHESYKKQLERTNGAPVGTYVPFRNGLFLSAAAAVAISKGCDYIYYGGHADDAAGCAYPDCSPEFNRAMGDAIFTGSGTGLKLEAPFGHMSKTQVVAAGVKLGVPYELTWSCYEGGQNPCGVCATCRDRRAAFAANGLDIL